MSSVSEKPKVLTFSVMPQEIDRDLKTEYDLLCWHKTDARPEIEANLDNIRGVITGGAVGLSTEWIARLPALEHIAVYGIGTDKVDLTAAKLRNITVSTTPGVLADDVADLGLSLILSLLRQTNHGERLVRSGQWAAGTKPSLGRSLKGAKLGILGMGQIGQALARRAQACDMVIHYWNRSTIAAEPGWVELPSPQDLAVACDVLVVCVALAPETINLVDADVIEKIGLDGYIVNIARGGIVNEDALIAALKEDRIAGAASDVFANEPAIRREWAELSNAILTPHIGSATAQARMAMGRIVIESLGRTLGDSLHRKLAKD